ncbi:MAG: hypothetical protein QM820_33770 [Minicystis sp.]
MLSVTRRAARARAVAQGSSCALLGAALALCPAAARAECLPGAADVSWVRLEGAESCPAAARIRADVARRVGTAVGGPGEGRSIDAVVQGGPGRWTAQIRTRGCGAEEAVREITSKAPTCEPIASAATLVIALAIDPSAALGPPRAAEAPAPAAPRLPPFPPPAPPQLPPPWPPQAPVAAPPPAPVAAPPPPTARVEATVTLRGLATVGLLPVIGLGLALSAEWSVTPLVTVTTDLAWLPERRMANPTYGFGMTVGSMGACLEVLRFTTVSLGPCGRVLGGAIDAVLYTNPAITPVAPGQRAWAGLGVGARLAVRVVGPLRAEAGLDAIAPLTRYAFALEKPATPVFQQPPVTGALFLGAGVTFR